MLDPRLLEILVCPKCKGALTLSDDPPALRCGHCRLSYPIRDGIPILLIDEAQPMGTTE
jgi:uncharacterized protein YbaR (Trm112 family)